MKAFIIVLGVIGIFTVAYGQSDNKQQRADGFARKNSPADSAAAAPKQHRLQSFPTDPMPNAYRGDRCVEIPNGYRGDNCVSMPNLYHGPLVTPAQPDSIRDKPLTILPKRKKPTLPPIEPSEN
ncbi:hypothetical protein JHJ32_11515 [Parapedobacter sp. ISTM3]|uniref:hypothetical protein n=1 Tax=Parapedobacter sp. ISTM3 TaxID=2800130 RepID=UPI0019076912|nr:hypothetical protein [Parapedobacter sp. ISTM3]MBK1440616.1 hypothetical protein [Parapedobacter sp. ISTM3]